MVVGISGLAAIACLPPTTTHQPPPMKTISSRQSSIARDFRELAANPDPDGARLLLDGVHLVREAMASGTTLEVAAVSSTHLQSDTEEGRLARRLEDAGVDVVVASDQVFPALSPVRTPSGIVAIGRRTPSTARDICAQPTHWILAALDVQDPGNVGSVLRAAEAAGMTGAFVGGASANPFSWKALRGSMGSALRLPVVTGLPTDSMLRCLESSGVRTVASVARGGLDPDAVDWRGSVALILGGEGRGLSHEVIARCDVATTIPMAPAVESLNVAVATGILAYAARRQRV
jgi:TrmH family RNA methyltransferase